VKESNHSEDIVMDVKVNIKHLGEVWFRVFIGFIWLRIGKYDVFSWSQ
jgi:hypothetical protein